MTSLLVGGSTYICAGSKIVIQRPCICMVLYVDCKQRSIRNWLQIVCGGPSLLIHRAHDRSKDTYSRGCSFVEAMLYINQDCFAGRLLLEYLEG